MSRPPPCIQRAWQAVKQGLHWALVHDSKGGVAEVATFVSDARMLDLRVATPSHKDGFPRWLRASPIAGSATASLP